MLELKSIEEEAADCRAAFRNSKAGDWSIHIHHGAECVEQFYEPPENRIAYILSQKSKEERAIRLRFMRPMTEEQAHDYKAKFDLLVADYKAKRDPLDTDYKAKRDPLDTDYKAKCASLYDDYKAKRTLLHLSFCSPDCPWDGQTLFPYKI